MYLYYLISFSLIFSLNFSKAIAQEWSYQNCDRARTEYTRRLFEESSKFELLSSTEGRGCLGCRSNRNSRASLLFNIRRVQDIYTGGDEIPKECFLTSALRGIGAFNEKYYVHCGDEGSQGTSFDGHNLHCVNEDYVNMVHKAFTDMANCFQLSPNHAKHLFRVINHESKSMLNVMSSTGARCLGQVTLGYAEEINRRIGISERGGAFPAYDRAIAKCPNLRDKKISQGRVTQKNAVTCELTQDIHKCLLYTFSGLTQHYEEISRKLETDSSVMDVDEFTELEKKMFLLPIRSNEMLRVRGVVGGKSVTLLLWDHAELYDYLQDDKVDVRSLRVDKVPLFEEPETVKWILNYWSHNGGASVYISILPAILRVLKLHIALTDCRSSPERESPLPPECGFRRKMENGGSLSSEEFVKLFEDKLREHYLALTKEKIEKLSEKKRENIRRRQLEVSGFARKVINDGDRLLQSDGRNCLEPMVDFQ